MKTHRFKYLVSVVFLLLLIACSTKKNTFLSRNSHALSTRYNILYNGQVALDKGYAGVDPKNVDNFWHRLPIERIEILEDLAAIEKPKNADFDLAETKGTKAIQKHSMNIGGKEKNYQTDEAYLLLGKARYYDQRFIPALDAFNYILYKYPTSSTIYEAKIWREKTNMRLGNDASVIQNMTNLLKAIKLKKQVLSDANSLLAEAFLNLEEKDSAVTKLKLAIDFSQKNHEKARYRYILGQLYEELGKKDSALYSYKGVIGMNRKGERKYFVHAKAKTMELFDYEKGDTIAFLKKYNKLLKDRENRPYLDLLFYQKGKFYDRFDLKKQALVFYNKSLRKNPLDGYLVASNYRNIGNMYFRDTNYLNAAKYYDSTLIKLDSKTREYVQINKKRKDLDEVILYEDISKRNDSILSVLALPESDRKSYFENYITKLKAADAAKKKIEEDNKKKLDNIAKNTAAFTSNNAVSNSNSTIPTFDNKAATAANSGVNTFYFYNPSTVSYGKLEFRKIWGNRTSNGNWRHPDENTNSNSNETIENEEAADVSKKVVIDEKEIVEYSPDFYLKKLPTDSKAIDSIAKERNGAYYQLGLIYKEKFKENKLAATKLEQLLTKNPEEKLIPPTLYNLYKIYQIIDESKAVAIKNKISKDYPNSHYSQIINNVALGTVSESTPEKIYYNLYKEYEADHYPELLDKLNQLINSLSGEALLPKFELLKANTIGKMEGVMEYKKALQFVADNYPNKEEGKKALEILTKEIPILEANEFTSEDKRHWNILYNSVSRGDNTTKIIEDVLTFYIENLENNRNKTVNYSYDFYKKGENLVVIHGLNSKEEASFIAEKLSKSKEKNCRIEEKPIIISNHNYKVIQIKKNLSAYLNN